jgi:hypothetical protein
MNVRNDLNPKKYYTKIFFTWCTSMVELIIRCTDCKEKTQLMQKKKTCTVLQSEFSFLILSNDPNQVGMVELITKTMVELNAL